VTTLYIYINRNRIICPEKFYKIKKQVTHRIKKLTFLYLMAFVFLCNIYKKLSYHAPVKYMIAAEKTTEEKFRWNKDELI
jgi:hypothetical protein